VRYLICLLTVLIIAGCTTEREQKLEILLQQYSKENLSLKAQVKTVLDAKEDNIEFDRVRVEALNDAAVDMVSWYQFCRWAVETIPAFIRGTFCTADDINYLNALNLAVFKKGTKDDEQLPDKPNWNTIPYNLFGYSPDRVYEWQSNYFYMLVVCVTFLLVTLITSLVYFFRTKRIQSLKIEINALDQKRIELNEAYDNKEKLNHKIKELSFSRERLIEYINALSLESEDIKSEIIMLKNEHNKLHAKTMDIKVVYNQYIKEANKLYIKIQDGPDEVEF
jgi:hypothetical protein